MTAKIIEPQPDIIDQGNGVFAIDTGYLRPRMDASHLLVHQGRGAFVDTGTASGGVSRHLLRRQASSAICACPRTAR